MQLHKDMKLGGQNRCLDSSSSLFTFGLPLGNTRMLSRSSGEGLEMFILKEQPEEEEQEEDEEVAEPSPAAAKKGSQVIPGLCCCRA